MPYSLTWMPQVLLAADLKVATVDGWEERARHGDVGRILGVLCHHTAGPAKGNMPSLNTLIHGRKDPDPKKNLAGPLAQLGLGRDGTFYVIAAGRANHAGKGIWNGTTNGNASFIGIEAMNTGLPDDPWPEVQMDAYRRGVAALLKHLGLPPNACAGHKEYAPGRKPDPSFDMNIFRVGVAALMAGTVAAPPVIPAIEPGPRSGATPRKTLRRNMTDPLVGNLQQKLGIAETAGVFDAATEAAVRVFQRANRLVPDGIVGPKTWSALDG